MNTVKTIAFVAPRLAEDKAAGGAETLLLKLAQQAALNGIEVTFLTTCAVDHFTWRNERTPGSSKRDSITFHFFPVNEDRDLERFCEVQARISRGVNVPEKDEQLWLQNNVNSNALLQHLKENGKKYDRIIAGPYLFGLIYYAALIHPEKTMLVPCLHDEPFAYLESFRTMFNQVRGCLFNTVPERELAVRLYDLSPDQPVVGMGVEDVSPAPAGSIRNKLKHNAPYVLYCGRREQLKGTPLLMDYICLFRQRTGKDIRLVLTGSGPVNPPPELNSALTDLGFVSETDKRAVMEEALAFIHPSLHESLSIVLLESWLAGTPALVHAGSAVLKDQCRRANGGLWFKNYPEFEECLLLLLDKPELRATLGQSGRKYVLEEYSWKSVNRRLLAALGCGS